MNQHNINNERHDHERESSIKQLEANLQVCLNGRVRELRLIESGNGLIVRGRAATFHVKQLAQHAILKATTRPLLANEIEVLEQTDSPHLFTL